MHLECGWKQVGELGRRPPRRPVDNLAFSWKLQAVVRPLRVLQELGEQFFESIETIWLKKLLLFIQLVVSIPGQTKPAFTNPRLELTA